MRNTPTELVLLQIAEGLQNLAANPDLSNKIKEAYALSEEEKAKADEARQVIAQADAFTADLQKKLDAVEDAKSILANAKAIQEKNADKEHELNKRSKELDTQLVKQKAQTDALVKAQYQLAEAQEDLTDRKAQIAKQEALIEQAKADIKKRAEIVGATVAGL